MKTTLIFLHGGPGFKDYLSSFFNTLTDRFDCVFYDQVRGFEVRLQDMLMQLDQIVQSTPGKKVLVGHSWGAILGAEYALKLPNKLSGLVLMSTGLSHKHWKDDYHNELNKLGLKDASAEQIFLASEEVGLGAPLLEKCLQTFSEETFNSINDSYLSNYDLTSKIADLPFPILNIFGEKDVRFSARIARTFKSFNNGIVDIQIAGAGHFPFLQENGRKKIFKALEDTFLKG